jgi:hypothetical protein
MHFSFTGYFSQNEKDERLIEQEIEKLCPFQVDFGFFFLKISIFVVSVAFAALVA